MPIAIACPNCQSRYSLPETSRGKKIRCKKCSNLFEASAAAGGAATTEASPATPVKKSGAGLVVALIGVAAIFLLVCTGAIGGAAYYFWPTKEVAQQGPPEMLEPRAAVEEIKASFPAPKVEDGKDGPSIDRQPVPPEVPADSPKKVEPPKPENPAPIPDAVKPQEERKPAEPPAPQPDTAPLMQPFLGTWSGVSGQGGFKETWTFSAQNGQLTIRCTYHKGAALAGSFTGNDLRLAKNQVTFTQVFEKKPIFTWSDNQPIIVVPEGDKLKFSWGPDGLGGSAFLTRAAPMDSPPAPTDPKPPAPVAKSGLTKENVARVKLGMTEAQVRAILGKQTDTQIVKRGRATARRLIWQVGDKYFVGGFLGGKLNAVDHSWLKN